MKTLKITQSQIEDLRKKFDMISGDKWKVHIEVTPWKGKEADWISIRLETLATREFYTLCAWDYDWVTTPGKIEMHIFWVGRDIGEQHIFDSYNCIKK